MPLDPSIILSGTRDAGAGIDVNALMQQQMQGMANINAMERQRKADELVMQDREAANLARALAPAIGSVFADPSDEGLNVALGLVPEQYRGAMQAQVDQLKGIPDLNRRKDVVRAALVQDEIGQALLAQLEPSANARLNADMAAQRAALDQRRMALEEQKFAQGDQVSADTAARLQFEREKLAAETAAKEAAGGLDPKVKLKLDQAYPQAARALQSSVTGLDQDIQDVENLLADQTGLKAITGYLGAYTPNISMDATRAQALLDKIMSGAGFSALQAMRDASPTGGALGNVSNQEGAKLEKSVAAFSQAQSLKDFQRALRQYLVDLKTAQQNVQAAFDETYSYRGEAPSAGIVEETKARRKKIEEETLPQGRTSLPPGVTVKRN